MAGFGVKRIMKLRIVLPALLLVATSAAADNMAGLLWVRSVGIDDSWATTNSGELREVLSKAVPEIVVVPADEADIVIEYRETSDDAGESWNATIIRFDCQAARLGERPTRAIHGHCPDKVYIRVDLGTLYGTPQKDTSGVDDFAAAFREAILTSSP